MRGLPARAVVATRARRAHHNANEVVVARLRAKAARTAQAHAFARWAEYARCRLCSRALAGASARRADAHRVGAAWRSRFLVEAGAVRVTTTTTMGGAAATSPVDVAEPTTARSPMTTTLEAAAAAGARRGVESAITRTATAEGGSGAAAVPPEATTAGVREAMEPRVIHLTRPAGWTNWQWKNYKRYWSRYLSRTPKPSRT